MQTLYRLCLGFLLVFQWRLNKKKLSPESLPPGLFAGVGPVAPLG